ncbi:MAG: cytochrome oxidase small assembly protein [Burkholderiales bacterium]
MQDDERNRRQRRATYRTALILVSIAVASFLGFFWKYWK